MKDEGALLHSIDACISIYPDLRYTRPQGTGDGVRDLDIINVKRLTMIWG